MGQGQGKGGAPAQPKATNGMLRSVLRNAPTPASDALVQQQSGSERHVTSKRDPVRITRPLDASPAPVDEARARNPANDGGSHPAVAPEARPTPAPPTGQLLPVVIRFTLPKPSAPAGGTPPPPPQVLLMLEHRQWEPIPMSASGDDFFAIVVLPKGQQAFKFSVNGQEVVDPNQPVSASGASANVVTVADATMAARENEDPIDDPADWGQEQTMFEDTKKLPPILPPHLRYSPLNTPPTAQTRQDSFGTILPGAEDLGAQDPENLPLPLTVTINHVYFQRRDDHTVLGATTRYRSKFATVVYYKGTAAERE